MSEYVIQGQTLTSIANAIRAQLGTQQQYTPESMAAAIESIQVGGGDTSVLDAVISGTISSIKNTTANTIKQYLFFGNKNLTEAYLSASTAEQYAFGICSALLQVCFTGQVTLNSLCFFNSLRMKSVILMSPTVCVLANTSAFNGTPIAYGTGYIYVPDSLVAEYQSATNWATYAAQIKGLSEIPAEVQEWLDQMEAAA